MATAQIIDRIGQPIWILDGAAQTVLHANPAALAFGGAPGTPRSELLAMIAATPVLLAQEQQLPWDGESVPAVLGLTGTANRYRLAARAAGVVVFDWNMQTDELTWTCEGGDAFGYDTSVFPLRVNNWLNAIHPEDLARMQAAVGTEQPSDGAVWEESYRFRRSDGQYAHVLDRGYLLRDKTGQPERMVGAMIDVTALHAAEERFRLATSASTDVIFIFDADTGRHWWSDALIQHYGHLPQSGPEGLSRWQRLIHPDDLEKATRSHAEAMAAQADSWSCEYRLIRADGTYAQVIDRARFLRHPDGRLSLSVGSIVDITALREGQERFRLAAKASQDVVYDWSPDSGEIWRSENYATTFLLDPEARDSGPGSWHEAIHPEDRNRVTRARDMALAKQLDRWEESYRVIRGDGRIAHVIDRALAQRDETGRLLRIIGSIVDVTLLREEEDRLRALLHVAADAIYDIDLRKNTVSWSDGMLRTFGHDWEGTQPIADNWESKLHPEDARRQIRAFQLFVAGRQDDLRSEYRFRRGDGSYAHVRDRARALRDENGEAFRIIGSMEDVSAAVEAAERLHQAQKLDAVGKLTGGVAHDFNNLLTVILGNAELLSQGADPDEQMALAGAIAQAAERGADLVASLLSFARKQPLQPRALSPSDVLAELTRMLTRTLPAYVTLRLDIPPDLWPVAADPTQLQTALLNLAVNACDAMPEGGQLMIEMENVQLDRDYAASHPGARAGEFLRITFSDTGFGMPPEVLARAFDPFFTTKPAGKGSGLGLSMVHGFASQSGGHVSIYSELSHGTSVSLYLPRSAESIQLSRLVRPETPENTPMGQGEHVLVAEDDPALRSHVQRLVENLGYRVTAAPDGQSALDALRAAGDVDLLFTDVVMPGELPGRALAERACAEFPALRVLFTSGYSGNAIVHQGRLDPGVHLLSKPYRREELAQKLREVLAAPLPEFLVSQGDEPDAAAL